MRRMDVWQDSIAAALAKAGARGQLRPDVPAALLARILFDIHLVEVRRRMSADQPDPAQGQSMLRQMFAATLQNRLPVPGG